ncbi:MAG: hypothetical protein IJ568_01805 [Bacilli bacterium]|nr:hypothetical protein [Bacilli bacterium]
MRESFGGTMLMWIVLFFLSIFIAFMASIIRYARVYKIKNSAINYIERQEGLIDSTELRNELTNLGYPQNGKFVVCRYLTDRGGFYYLKLFATFSFPIVGISFDVRIKGETKTIETGVLLGYENSAGNNTSSADGGVTRDGSTGSTFSGKASCLAEGVYGEEVTNGRYWD